MLNDRARLVLAGGASLLSHGAEQARWQAAQEAAQKAPLKLVFGDRSPLEVKTVFGLGGKLSTPHVSFYGLFDTPGWFGATTPFWFASILCLVNIVFIIVMFPETLLHPKEHERIHIGTAVQNVIRGFSSDRLRVLLGTSFFFNAGFTFFTTFFGVYLANKFGFTQSVTGDYFALVGLFIAITQAVLVPRIARHLIDFKVMRFSYFGLAVAMAFYFTAGSKWQLYAIIPIFTAFNGMSMANLTSLISRSAEPGRQGEAMGISSSVMNLAQVPASVLVGYITGSLTSNTPLVVSCTCIAVAGVVFVAFFRPKYVSSTPSHGHGAPAH
mgnify:CR=1 FL=1